MIPHRGRRKCQLCPTQSLYTFFHCLRYPIILSQLNPLTLIPKLDMSEKVSMSCKCCSFIQWLERKSLTTDCTATSRPYFLCSCCLSFSVRCGHCIKLPPPEVYQLYNQVFNECTKKQLCMVAFLPHILDTGASGRNDYTSTVHRNKLSKSLSRDMLWFCY